MDEKKSKLAGAPRRVAAIAIAAALSMAMGPAPALADAKDGTALVGATHALSAEAEKETVYVVSGIKAKLPDYGFIVKGGKLCPAVMSKSVKLSYNGNGLLARKRETNSRAGSARKKEKRTTWYSYNGKANLTSSRVTDANGYAERTKYTLDKSGKFKKSTWRQTSQGKISSKCTTKYTYKSGRIAKASTRTNGAKKTNDRVFTYDEGGRLASYTTYYHSTFHPSFDSHGNVESDYLTYDDGNGGMSYAHENKYDKKGRLVRKAVNGMTYKYAYKAVEVSAGMAAKVEAQQWALLNDNLNAALGYTDMASYFGDIR